MNNAIVPDISFYQNDVTTPGGVNFDVMNQAGAAGVIIRAGQNLWVDEDFAQNWLLAKNNHLARGSYWFYDSRVDPKRQAELWISTLGDDQGELPLFADFEDRYDGDYFGWQHWYNFLEAVKALAPLKEIFIYTGYYYWLEEMQRASKESQAYFKQYPLWIAAYNTEAPKIPPPFDDWTFWQYTDNGDGTLYGVESKNIDLSYFNGTVEEFITRFNLSTEPPIDPIPPTGEIPVNELIVTVIWPQGASVKNNPNTGGTAPHVYKQHETFYASEIVPDNTDPTNTRKQWAHISQGTYAGKYVAVSYPSSGPSDIRCTYEPVVPPPTTPNIPIKVTAETLADGSISVVVITEDENSPVSVKVNKKTYIPDPNQTFVVE